MNRQSEQDTAQQRFQREQQRLDRALDQLRREEREERERSVEQTWTRTPLYDDRPDYSTGL